MCHCSTDTFQTKLYGVDYALLGQPLSQHHVSDVIECLGSAEYTSASHARNCELHAISKNQGPKDYVIRPGYTYYESEK